MTDTSPAALLAVAEQFANTSTVPSNFSAVLRAIAAEKEAQAKQEPFAWTTKSGIARFVESGVGALTAYKKHCTPAKECQSVPLYLAPQPVAEKEAQQHAHCEPFVVRHYSSDERPLIKGNGFDGLEIGNNRDEAETFVAWINERLKTQHHPEQPLERVATADVPLPAHTISGPAGTGTYFNGHTDAALLAHREAYAKAAVAAEREMREALELIAAPKRPDGTWNRDREACRQLAAEALGRYDEKQKGM